MFYASHFPRGSVDATEPLRQESRPLGRELSQGTHEYEKHE